MTQQTETAIPGRIDWAYIRAVVFARKRVLLVAHLVAILAAIVAVPVPLLMPMLVDEVLLGRPGIAVATLNRLLPDDWQTAGGYICAVLFATVLLRVLGAFFNVVQTRQFSLISKDVIYRIRCRLISHLERISMAEYENLGSGAVVTHMVTDLDTLDAFVGSTVARSLVAVLTLAGTAAVLFWMHWKLALFIVLLNPVVIFFTRVLGKQVKALKRDENAAIGAFQSALTETLDAIHQIRASNRERHYFERLVTDARAVRQHSAAYAWKSDAASRMSFLVFLTGFDVFRGVALLMVVYSDLSVGEMMAVAGYLWFMMAPVQEVLGMQYAYFGAKAALERINRFCHRQVEPQYPHCDNPFTGKDTVGVYIEDLHFSYGQGGEILQGIRLDIQPGEKIALVGASGGGKSTLMQVLIGLYPPSRGMIYFDGVPIDRIGMDVVREHVVTVLQHPILFNDTIRANLTMGRPATEAALWAALEVAQMRDVIEDCPDGLDAVVGRQGMRLSGGQRQRLAIARMVLADPKVVILDEATSAVDNVTEAHLYRALDAFLEGRTTLIVAHRLSAITHADRILVFEDGKIVEDGDHETLISRRGLYSKLYGVPALALAGVRSAAVN